MLLVGASVAFGWIITVSDLAGTVSSGMFGLTDNPYVLLLLLNIFLLVVGMFLDAGPAILVLGPVLAPGFLSMGIHPSHFAIVMCVNVPVGLATPPLGLVLFVIINISGWDMTQRVAATVGLVALGYYLPAIYIKNVAKKRLASIIPVFPDALDLLLICVEAGMSVELAFGRVAEEMGDASVELAEEFSLTTAEPSYLTSRRMAYENLARRNNHPGIRAVATALVQAERYGTPLGDTLRTMANENRQMRVMQAEKKAAALPAKLTVPMILFFLPVLFIVILTPAALRIGQAF